VHYRYSCRRAEWATAALKRLITVAAAVCLPTAASAAPAPARDRQPPPGLTAAPQAFILSRGSAGTPHNAQNAAPAEPLGPAPQSPPEQARSSAQRGPAVPSSRMHLSLDRPLAPGLAMPSLHLSGGLLDGGSVGSTDVLWPRTPHGKSSSSRTRHRSGVTRAYGTHGPADAVQAGSTDVAASAAGKAPPVGVGRGREDTNGAAPSEARVSPGSRLVLFGPVVVNENEEIGTRGSLTSRHKLQQNSAADDRQRGLTSTDTVHSLNLGVGGGSKLEATFSDHTEEWSAALARSSVQRRSSSIELTSEFGPARSHALCLAMTTSEQRVGEQSRSEAKREARLNLAPTRRLELNADYTTRSRADGNDETIRTVGAVLKLARQSELAASLRALTPEKGSDSRESALRLSTALGGGTSLGNLTAERRVVASDGAGIVTRLNWGFAGNLGSGSERTNIRASVQDQRGSEPQGRVARVTAMHLDRQLGPRLRLKVERDERIAGTAEDCTVIGNSTYRVETKVAANTILAAVVGWRATLQEGRRRVRELSAQHNLGRVRLEAEQQLWADGMEAGAVTGLAVEMPTGRLPKWAKDMSRRHEFGDARGYLALEELRWEDIDFAGFRVAAKQRQGGIDDALHTVSVAHRRTIADRYHLRLLYQQCPEAGQGLDQGRPEMVRRTLFEVGTPVRKELLAVARLTRESGAFELESDWHTVEIGLQGQLSQRERLEARISHERDCWEDELTNRTALTLLYARQVSDEDHLSLKLGYAWGEEGLGRDVRDWRLNVGYAKPI